MIAGGEYGIVLSVVDEEGKVAYQAVDEVFTRALEFLVQRQDHLAVGSGFELIGNSKLLFELLVVIDLTIDGQNVGFIFVIKRLGSVLRINNGESFVNDHGVLALIGAFPVGTAVKHKT